MWGGPQDVFLSFEFQVDCSPNFGATWVKNRPFSLTRHVAYTTIFSYRSSCDSRRDNGGSFIFVVQCTFFCIRTDPISLLILLWFFLFFCLSGRRSSKNVILRRFKSSRGDFVLSTVKVESIMFAHRSLPQHAYAAADMQQHLSAACAG